MAKEVYQVPKTAGDLFFNYRLTVDSCSSSEVEFRIKNQVTWLTVTEQSIPGYEHPFKVHYAQNSGAPRDGVIIPVVKTGSSEKECEDEWGIVISQTGDSCGCGDLNLNTSTLEWANDNKSPQTKSYSVAGGCVNVTNVTSSNNHFGVTFGNGTITVTPSDFNTGSGPIEGTITVVYTADGGTCTNATFSVKHNGTGCECGQTYFSISPSSLEWEFDQQGNKEITITSASCISDINATISTQSQSGHFTVESVANSKITVKANGTNGTDAPYTGTMVVTYKANGTDCTSINVNLNHKSSNCTCDDFDLYYDSLSWTYSEYGESDSETNTYRLKGTCITVGTPTITGNDSGHFTATTESNGIKVWPLSANSEAGKKTATVSVPYSTSTNPNCGTKTFEVEHNGTGCDCEDLILTVDEIEWKPTEYGQQTAQTISYTIAPGKEGCIDTSSIEVTVEGDTEYFYINKNNPSAVVIYPLEENEDENMDYELTVTYTYNLSSGAECDGDYGTNVCNVVQLRAACSCTKLNSSPCILTTIPLSAGTYYLGTGDTNHCGTFSGRSTAQYVSAVTVNTNSQGISSFYVVTKNAPEGSTADIDIFFKYYGDEQESCTTTKNILQTASYVSCARFNTGITFNKSTVFYSSTPRVGESFGYIWDGSVIGHPEWVSALCAFNDRGLLTFTSNKTWLHDVYLDMNTSSGTLYIRGTFEVNDTGDERTADVTISLNATAAREYGLCSCGTKQIIVTAYQKGNSDCNCSTSDYEKSVPADSGSFSFNDTYFKPECFDSTKNYKYVIADSNKNPIMTATTASCSDDRFVSLPGNNWLTVCIQEYELDGKIHYHLDYKFTTNNTGSERSDSFYVLTYFTGETCERKFIITQPNKEGVVCEDAYKAFINVKSGDTYSSSRLDYKGGSDKSLAQYSYTSEYTLGTDYTISGGVVGNCSWLEYIDETPPDAYADFVVLPNFDDNVVSENNDASTNKRHCDYNIRIVDKNGNLLKDKDGNDCTGLTLTVYQEGFSGYCPACSSMNNVNDISVSYTDSNGKKYGEGHSSTADGLQCVWDAAASTPEYVPAFHGDGSTTLNFFEVDLQNIITTHDGTDIRCFDLIAETDHTDVVNKAVTATRVSGSMTKYIISGKLRKNTSANFSSISIKLYLAKRNFLTGQNEKCGGEPQQGHIKLLVDGKDCNNQ